MEAGSSTKKYFKYLRMYYFKIKWWMIFLTWQWNAQGLSCHGRYHSAIRDTRSSSPQRPHGLPAKPLLGRNPFPAPTDVNHRQCGGYNSNSCDLRGWENLGASAWCSGEMAKFVRRCKISSYCPESFLCLGSPVRKGRAAAVTAARQAALGRGKLEA